MKLLKQLGSFELLYNGRTKARRTTTAEVDLEEKSRNTYCSAPAAGPTGKENVFLIDPLIFLRKVLLKTFSFRFKLIVVHNSLCLNTIPWERFSLHRSPFDDKGRDDSDGALNSPEGEGRAERRIEADEFLFRSQAVALENPPQKKTLVRACSVLGS